MNIHFNINFHTQWGQEVFITGSCPELGLWETNKALRMHHSSEGNWHLETDIDPKEKEIFYHYLIKQGDKIVRREGDKNHTIGIRSQKNIYAIDYWQEEPQISVYESSAFTECWFRRKDTEKNRNEEANITFKARVPYLKGSERLAICGNQEAWNHWQTPQFLSYKGEAEWEFSTKKDSLQNPVEFKLCKVDETGEITWEEGENRTINLPLDSNGMIIISGLQFREREYTWKAAGLAIPVFSLRSENSFGIGDFGDLKRIVDWVKLTGQEIIQILPINDTTMTHTWTDSYPYNAISIYALHPLYVNIRKLGKLSDKKKQAEYNALQKELNRLNTVDYTQVDRAKWAYIRAIYEELGENTLSSSRYKSFFEKNKDWLIPYAAYSFLRDKYGTPDFKQWSEYAVYDQHAVEKFTEQNSRDISIYYYIQYHLHLQLKEVRDYAHRQGIVLKGDIPIGISRMSIEAWSEPYYFNMDFQAGAPPDAFSETGQNWGFPTYNWPRMEEDRYRWWINRFGKMAEYFDAYRIDHILGFFRIWQIPINAAEGLLGYFYPALPFDPEELIRKGFPFQKERHTKARIHEKYLEELFGEYSNEAVQTYLNRVDASHFELKAIVGSQRKIESIFKDKETPKDQRVKAGLFAISCEVLFIEDHEQSGYYHPRISASRSYTYRDMDGGERMAFDALYNSYFYHRHNAYWEEQAIRHLTPLVKSTNMLACGEDLGMIPASVPDVMKRLNILSLEIERMPKQPGLKLAPLAHLPYLSVCSTSTHDMSTIRGWWIDDRGEDTPKCDGKQCEEILRRNMLSGAMLAIVPFQDWLSISEKYRNPDYASERINIPANPRHYWRYRMHLTIEQLLLADELNQAIKRLTSLRNAR